MHVQVASVLPSSMTMTSAVSSPSGRGWRHREARLPSAFRPRGMLLPAVPPFLSVIVPTFNEGAGITGCLSALRDTLPLVVPSWEIVVADDGSGDDTAEIVSAVAAGDPRVRLLRLAHRGKGAAVKAGLLAARGVWRFMADADLSMPPGELRLFLARVEAGPHADILIGSREARNGGARIGEPRSRYLIGRAFNALVRLVAVPGVRDTQCGFKLFSAQAVAAICPHMKIDGFAFDVEMLFIARRAGLTVGEVGITWRCRQDSRVAVRRGATAFLEVISVRTRAWRGEYATVAHALPEPRT